MPTTEPDDFLFTKKVNSELQISLSYKEAPGHSDKLDCVIQLTNLHDQENQHNADTPYSGGNSSLESETDVASKGQSEDTSSAAGGWLRAFWSSDSSRLIPEEKPEIPLLLGYIQLFGYVRLNHQIGADNASENSMAVYWKNSEYVSTYCGDKLDEKLQQVLCTPLFKDYAGEAPRKSHIAGVNDLQAHSFDVTAHYLLHDMAHPFGTMDVPSDSTTQLPANHQKELASNLSKFVVPFYITSQHLMFSSVAVQPGLSQQYRFRVPMPPKNLPPSYNTRSTGSVGEAGLASIVYSFVVGVQENIDGQMNQRTVYFPLELRRGHFDSDQTWRQHDYLQQPLVDKQWSPEDFPYDSPNHDSTHREGTGAPPKLNVYNKAATSPKDISVINNSTADSLCSETFPINGGLESSNGNGTSSYASRSAENVNPDISNTANKRRNSSISSTKSHGYSKFVDELDTLIDGSLESLATRERRKSSVFESGLDNSGAISQVPAKSRLSYQIRVNNQSLCLLNMSSTSYHIGDDINFWLKFHPESAVHTKIVGFTTHAEAHEIFHLEEGRKMVNIYKVTPTMKTNTYADALMYSLGSAQTTKFATSLNVPRHLTQQFQASSFMDLRYFMVFRFVLNDIMPIESISIDKDAKMFTDYIQEYKIENESTEFKFSIPLTVLA